MANVAPTPNNPIFQLVLRGKVAKDTPVPFGTPPDTLIVNVFNYIVLGVTGPSYTPVVTPAGGLGSDFFTKVWTPLIAALNVNYTGIGLYVRSLTDANLPPTLFTQDGGGGSVIAGTSGQVTGEMLPLQNAATFTVVYTGGRGNNGKLRKSFGPLSSTDTMDGTAPTFTHNRLATGPVIGGTGINWLAVKAALVAVLTDGVQNFTPFLFSRNQSVLVPPTGPAIIRGWTQPAAAAAVLNLSIGSLDHRNERIRPTV